MENIIIKAPTDIDCGMREWEARYQKVMYGLGGVTLISIESKTAIEIVVAEVDRNLATGNETFYYISSPNLGVAIPPIASLLESYWIMERLLDAGVSATDAVTIAQVLRDMEEKRRAYVNDIIMGNQKSKLEDSANDIEELMLFI